jgi:hypothetical protein
MSFPRFPGLLIFLLLQTAEVFPFLCLFVAKKLSSEKIFAPYKELIVSNTDGTDKIKSLTSFHLIRGFSSKRNLRRRAFRILQCVKQHYDG